MSTIVQSKYVGEVRCAVVYEHARIRPVWFEDMSLSRPDRMMISKVNQVWESREGAAKIVSFAVTAAGNSYSLTFDSLAFTWTLHLSEESPFP